MNDRKVMQFLLDGMGVSTKPLAKYRQEVLRAMRSLREPVAQPGHTAVAPLSSADYSAIRAKLCEAHPGDWLHHYGPAVEAEIMKRLGAAS